MDATVDGDMEVVATLINDGVDMNAVIYEVRMVFSLSIRGSFGHFKSGCNTSIAWFNFIYYNILKCVRIRNFANKYQISLWDLILTYRRLLLNYTFVYKVVATCVKRLLQPCDYLVHCK